MHTQKRIKLKMIYVRNHFDILIYVLKNCQSKKNIFSLIQNILHLLELLLPISRFKKTLDWMFHEYC